MIDERLEELASLHVLGALSAEESRDFQKELRQNAELRKLVADLNGVTDALAGNVPLIAPPPELRENILAELDQRQKIVPLPKQNAPVSHNIIWLPWALAACLAIFCGVLGFNFVSEQRALVATRNSLNENQQAMKQMAVNFANTTNDLQAALAQLQQDSQITNVHVAVLAALLPDEPKAMAVSLWDQKNQTGEFIAQSLTPLATDKDYQLWVIDPQYPSPVDAGVFQVDDQGKVRVQFKTKYPIKTAVKFAVTREDKGGSSSPKGQMVLISG